MKNNLKIAISLFFLIFPSLSSAKTVIIARVNDKIITNYDLSDRYRFLKLFNRLKISKNAVQSRIIDKMIDEEIIRQQAKKLKITTSSNEIKGAIEGFARKKGVSYQKFKRSFAKKGISFQNFSKQVESELLWSKIITKILRPRIKISDLEIREFLEQKNQETDITQYKIAEIFIPKQKDSKTLVQKLYLELKEGANFNDFVRQFSQSDTAENNGEIGFVSKSDIDEKIYQEISQIEINQYSKPIFLQDGYHIFKLLDKKTSQKISDSQQNFAKQRIFMQKIKTSAKSYMMKIKKDAFIEIYLD